jgi:hypothetical protein
MTQILKRDPSTGRFTARTVPEKVAAHVPSALTSGILSIGQIAPLTTSQPIVLVSATAAYDPEHPVRDLGRTEGTGGKGAYKPKRSQPIEYDKPNWITDNFLWLVPVLLALIALIVVLTH